MRHDHHSSRQGAEWGSPLHVDRVFRNELLLLSSRRRRSGSTASRATGAAGRSAKGARL